MSKKHPQFPPFANEQEMESFLKRPLLARFCSLNANGSIHATPIYYLYQDGEFLFGTQVAARKIQNIRRDKHVTVLIDTDEPVLQSVLVYGNAELDFEDVLEKRVKILERYYEDPAQARAFAQRLAAAWQTVIIRVKPTKVVSVDYTRPFSID
ncbi:MAG TPA: pyridoxamine 5'-phosphate oxidase family protein [Anaerolineaceae bacterium]|nr:pyridoxamine 5'-phosphate oxidase family protein [Anaerolineaceae bacterium]